MGLCHLAEYGLIHPGSIETTGNFALTNRWSWGWDGILPTDSTFFQNYGLSTYQRGTNILVNGLTEGVSQAFLSGRGDRSYFDVRAIYYYGFSEADSQAQIPVIHPVELVDWATGGPRPAALSVVSAAASGRTARAAS